jgi:hypothetical protein
MANSRPARTEQPRAGLFLSRRGLATGRAGLLSAFDPAEMGKRDETKFVDARNSAETEMPYSLEHVAIPRGLDLNLIDFEPRLALAEALSWNTVTKIDNILMFCCVSGFFAGVVVAVATLLG